MGQIGLLSAGDGKKSADCKAGLVSNWPLPSETWLGIGHLSRPSGEKLAIPPTRRLILVPIWPVRSVRRSRIHHFTAEPGSELTSFRSCKLGLVSNHPVTSLIWFEIDHLQARPGSKLANTALDGSRSGLELFSSAQEAA